MSGDRLPTGGSSSSAMAVEEDKKESKGLPLSVRLTQDFRATVPADIPPYLPPVHTPHLASALTKIQRHMLRSLFTDIEGVFLHFPLAEILPPLLQVRMVDLALVMGSEYDQSLAGTLSIQPLLHAHSYEGLKFYWTSASPDAPLLAVLLQNSFFALVNNELQIDSSFKERLEKLTSQAAPPVTLQTFFTDIDFEGRELFDFLAALYDRRLRDGMTPGKYGEAKLRVAGQSSDIKLDVDNLNDDNSTSVSERLLGKGHSLFSRYAFLFFSSVDEGKSAELIASLALTPDERDALTQTGQLFARRSELAWQSHISSIADDKKGEEAKLKSLFINDQLKTSLHGLLRLPLAVQQEYVRKFVRAIHQPELHKVTHLFDRLRAIASIPIFDQKLQAYGNQFDEMFAIYSEFVRTHPSSFRTTSE